MIRRLSWCWLLACVVSCTSTLPTQEGQPDADQAKQLMQLQHWSLEGKLAVTVGDDRQSVRFRWTQQANHFDVRLAGPAGLKATHLYSNTAGVVLEQGDHREQAMDAETLSQRLIGWPLPANQFRHWLKGLPAPGTPPTYTRYAENGLLTELTQDGWTLHFSQHQQHGNVLLPGHIEARSDRVRVVLLAKQWQLTP